MESAPRNNNYMFLWDLNTTSKLHLYVCERVDFYPRDVVAADDDVVSAVCEGVRSSEWI